MLDRTVHLAGCSLAPRSTEMDAALARMLDAMAAGGLAWDAFEAEAGGLRDRYADLVGARPDEVALTPNATIGAYQAASDLLWDARPVIVTTRTEFPSVAHVWLAQAARGATVRFVEDAVGGGAEAGPTYEAYAAAVDGRTGLVSVPLVTYQDALRPPVTAIARLARAAGAAVFVDAYQGLGTQPVSVADLGADYLVGGNSKYLLGLPGTAFLYARSGRPHAADPTLTGWFGRRDPFAFDPARLDFPDGARRFETGTAPIPAVYAANAGLDLIAGLELAAVRSHVSALGEYVTGRLTGEGETVRVGEPDRRGAHVALAEPDGHALGAWMARHDITVSPRGNVVRLAPHFYSTIADMDAFCDLLKEYRHRNTATADEMTRP
jgi:selenocysteine lyase/cysteine desulfurase